MMRSLLLLLCLFVSSAYADGDGYLPLYRLKGIGDVGLFIRQDQVRQERYYRFGQTAAPSWMAAPSTGKGKISVFGVVENQDGLNLRKRTFRMSDQFSMGSVPYNPFPGHGGGVTIRLKDTTASFAIYHDGTLGMGRAFVLHWDW